MKETINLLIDLNRIDVRLLEMQESMGSLPSRLEKQTDKLDNLKEAIDNKRKNMKQSESDKKSAIIGLDDYTAKLEKYKDQLFKVKNNKEYDAITVEMTFVNDKIDGSKKIISGFEEKISSYEEDIKSDEDNVLSLEKEIGEIKSSIDSLNKENKAEQSKLEKLRGSAKKKIDQYYLDLYERSQSLNKGIGMAELESDACSHCYTVVPQNLAIEIKSRTEFCKCPSCSVYLYTELEEN